MDTAELDFWADAAQEIADAIAAAHNNG